MISEMASMLAISRLIPISTGPSVQETHMGNSTIDPLLSERHRSSDDF